MNTYLIIVLREGLFVKKEKIISFIRENRNGIILPFILFIASFAWSISADHLNNIYKMGYLSYFDIKSFYDIEGVNFNIFLTSFILLILFCASVWFIPYCFNNICPLPLKKKKNLKFYMLILIHFASYAFITWLLLQIFFVYVIKIESKINISDIINASWLIKEFFYFSLIIGIAEIITECMIKKSDYKINSLSKNDNKKIKSKKNKQIKFWEIALMSFLLLGFSLFFLDNLLFSFGEMAAQLHTFYPSFVENDKEYIMIAKMENQNYLIIQLPTEKESNKNTICFIKDISNIPLVDKNVNGIFGDE